MLLWNLTHIVYKARWLPNGLHTYIFPSTMMLHVALSILAGIVVLGVQAHPIKHVDTPTINDVTVLNFALALEYLESTFYTLALEKYDDDAFISAGFSKLVRDKYVQILQHEQEHVFFLTDALGDQATQPCTYQFTHTDPRSFAAMSRIIEGVGVSAYVGSTNLISNKAFSTAVASILATESRHASWIDTAVTRSTPWSTAFDVPLSANEVFSIVSAFITSCPATNPSVPFKAFPVLSLTPNGGDAGSSVTPCSPIQLQFNSSSVPSGTELFAAFFTGLDVIFAPVNGNGSVILPEELTGTVYVVVSKNSTSATDNDIVAGPLILEVEFDSAY